MTDNTFTFIPLADAVAPVREQHRSLIDAAVAWSAGRERRLDPDHAALVCAAVENGFWKDRLGVTRWTRTGVYHVVRCDLLNWCSAQRTLYPETICEVMWDWFDFLHATGRLDAESDPVAELRKPLACYGRLDQDGRPLPEGAERQVECECHLPYRETTELLGEILMRCERTGEEPLDVLRRAAGRVVTPSRSPWDDIGAGGRDDAGAQVDDDGALLFYSDGAARGDDGAALWDDLGADL